MMFSGFFGSIFALFCVGAVAVGGAVGIYKSYSLSQRKRALQGSVSSFVQTHNLTDCELGFYNGAEKELASMLDISVNEAYRMISIELSKHK